VPQCTRPHRERSAISDIHDFDSNNQDAGEAFRRLAWDNIGSFRRGAMDWQFTVPVRLLNRALDE